MNRHFILAGLEHEFKLNAQKSDLESISIHPVITFPLLQQQKNSSSFFLFFFFESSFTVYGSIFQC
jgi:hypothetical protein